MVNQYVEKSNKSEMKRINVYLDFATIPSLKYFLHFVSEYEDYDTIRLFGLSRFTIPESLIKRYPEGIIQFYPNQNKNFDSLIQVFESLISQNGIKWEVNVHLNLCHYISMTLPFLNIYLQYRHNIDELKLYFYDDGSEGVSTLYNLSEKEDLPELIEKEIAQMDAFWIKKECETNVLTRYFWRRVLPTKYYLWNTDILEKAELSRIKSELGDYQRIDFTEFENFSITQQELIFEIFNLDKEIISVFRRVFAQNKTFLFTGTTLFDVFDEDKERMENLHYHLLNDFCSPSGRFFNNKSGYLMFYKGHPKEPEMNERLAKKLPHLNLLPEYIPIEVLCLVGIKPTRIGGFSSSSYFHFERGDIEEVIFFTTKEYNEEHRIFSAQHNLMRALLELNYLSPNQVYTHFDFENYLATKI